MPIVPGTESAVTDLAGCEAFCAEYGFPIIIKAAFGGGGRGMRVVRTADELKQSYESASNEACGRGDPSRRWRVRRPLGRGGSAARPRRRLGGVAA